MQHDRAVRDARLLGGARDDAVRARRELGPQPDRRGRRRQSDAGQGGQALPRRRLHAPRHQRHEGAEGLRDAYRQAAADPPRDAGRAHDPQDRRRHHAGRGPVRGRARRGGPCRRRERGGRALAPRLM